MNPLPFKKGTIPNDVLNLCHILSLNGKKAYLVGGSIRDTLMGLKTPNDWDIATNATPNDVMKIFGTNYRIIPTGIAHGTVKILHSEFSIEITTFRVENSYKNGRRPSKVVFVESIEEDLSRRDLTVNSLAYDPENNQLIDPYNGLEDINSKVIRMVGDPDKRLEEDGLRLIRIFRFASQLGFKISDDTLNAIPKHFNTFRMISKERIHSELQKLIQGSYWKSAIILLIESGVFFEIFPKYKNTIFHEKIPNLNENRITILKNIIGKLSINSSKNLRFAVLLHQLSHRESSSQIIFPRVNKKLLSTVLRRNKFSNSDISEIIHLLSIYLNALPYKITDPNEKKNYYMRRLLFNIKPYYFRDFLDFYEAKQDYLRKSKELKKELLDDMLIRSKMEFPIELKDLCVSGNDIINYFGINKALASEREFIGLTLNIIRERVEFLPSLNKKSNINNLLDDLKRIYCLCEKYSSSKISIISTDSVRKIYRDNKPDYLSWENNHTYELSKWLIQCLLRKNKDARIIFDGTNFNLPGHLHHREKLAYKFKKYNPLFIHSFATEEETKENLLSRQKEIESLDKSDADLKVYYHYKGLLERHPNTIAIPLGFDIIHVYPRKNSFQETIKAISEKIKRYNYRLIIFSGNVLSGKTFTANRLKTLLNEEPQKES